MAITLRGAKTSDNYVSPGLQYPKCDKDYQSTPVWRTASIQQQKL